MIWAPYPPFLLKSLKQQDPEIGDDFFDPKKFSLPEPGQKCHLSWLEQNGEYFQKIQSLSLGSLNSIALVENLTYLITN